MKQLKVGLPDSSREYLEDFARLNGRSVSEEARARIDQSIVDDRFDVNTKELGRDIMQLARMITEGSKWALPKETTWATDKRLFEALKVSIDAWMSALASRLDLSEGAQLDPITLGQSNAHAYAEIKPLLLKHRPGGDNMEDQK
jgi:hypothetical protein